MNSFAVVIEDWRQIAEKFYHTRAGPWDLYVFDWTEDRNPRDNRV